MSKVKCHQRLAFVNIRYVSKVNLIAAFSIFAFKIVFCLVFLVFFLTFVPIYDPKIPK